MHEVLNKQLRMENAMENRHRENLQHKDQNSQKGDTSPRRRSIDFATMTHKQIQEIARYNASQDQSRARETLSFTQFETGTVIERFSGDRPPVNNAVDRLSFHSLNAVLHDDSVHKSQDNSTGEHTPTPDVVNYDEANRRKLAEEYNRLRNHDLYNNYQNDARELGRLAAQDDELAYREQDALGEEDINRANLLRINHESVVQRYNAIANTFHERYGDYAESIQTFSRDRDLHNNNASPDLQINANIDNHIEIMNQVFNEHAAGAEDAFDNEIDWHVRPLGPLEDLRLHENSDEEEE